jgi:hypothetical protein
LQRIQTGTWDGDCPSPGEVVNEAELFAKGALPLWTRQSGESFRRHLGDKLSHCVCVAFGRNFANQWSIPAKPQREERIVQVLNAAHNASFAGKLAVAWRVGGRDVKRRQMKGMSVMSRNSFHGSLENSAHSRWSAERIDAGAGIISRETSPSKLVCAILPVDVLC